MNKNKILKIIIIIISIMTIFFITFFYITKSKKIKIGNNSSSQEIIENILNISSYESIIEIEVNSNKNVNRYVIKQKYAPDISEQEVLEPENIQGVKIVKSKNELKVENTKINIPIPKYLETDFNNVSVSTVDTGLANGDIYGEKFTKNNWKIENNEIIITIDNDTKAKMEESNEFYISYYYGQDAYEKYADMIRKGEYIDYTQSVNVEMKI